jgi:hypothetical protein
MSLKRLLLFVLWLMSWMKYKYVCVWGGGGRPNIVGLKFARLIKWTLGCGRREVLHKSEREQLLFIGDSGKKPKIPNIRVDCVLRENVRLC